jgi:hypothetical protein
MNITPINYANYNRHSCNKPNQAQPAFGSVHFTNMARKVITEHLYVADVHTRNEVMRKLEKIVKEGENTRDILVDAPDFVTGLVAKVGTKSNGQGYRLKTFIQSLVYDTKFLEEALEESKKPIQKK